LTKPPYGELVAVDLGNATIKWKIPLGDWPELRANPALKGVTLPKVLGIAGPQGPIVTRGGVLFVGGGDSALHAIDKTTGRELWQGSLPARSHGTPMTYRTRDGRQFVVIATGSGADASLVAFALPDGAVSK
jgi:quinoprotein glucose dehydrogenase